ncbi:LysR family transcriptional regulator [Psychromonas sp. RZ22]|uniref:LysR family transcriptional regulator n=1 Tax=Psychromonas algarum TaxID=2555643 RepID=UPI00106762A8|nr:LysR family transcriptional regulator [Psychromonas sp. RZ22]TEW54134.1 LysR family transcriptional regulator [Psychromonas sp. RZ22]
MLNQKHLNTFMKLVETEHFTQTAEQLFMTQPGVTQHIKKLEKHFDTLLLQRYGKRFELTLAGEKLYQTGLKMRLLEEQLNEEINHDDATQGICSMACSGGLASFLYPYFVQQQTLYPQLSVFVEAAPNKNIINDLLNNKVDLGIVTVESAQEQLKQTLLGYEELQLVLPTSIQVTGSECFAELNKIGFINHPDGLHFIEKVFSSNFKVDYKGPDSLNIKGYVNQSQQILLPVAKGLGFTILPKRAVLQFTEQQSLTIFPLKITVQEPLYLTQKRYRQLPTRYHWFESKIKQLLA